MKKTMFALLGGALLLATPACKKGANDPALSLKSRKARLAGEYVISKIDRTEVSTYSGNTTTTVFTYTGTSPATITTTSGGSTSTDTKIITLAEMTINKDGTWEQKWNDVDKYTFTSNIQEQTTTQENVRITKGSWAFVGKTKDGYKNKERVQLSILSETNNWKSTTVTKDLIFNTTTTTNNSGVNSSTYGALEYVMIYAIDMLKNKEMVFKYEEDDVYSNTSGGTTNTSTYKTDETMTLTQK